MKSPITLAVEQKHCLHKTNIQYLIVNIRNINTRATLTYSFLQMWGASGCFVFIYIHVKGERKAFSGADETRGHRRSERTSAAFEGLRNSDWYNAIEVSTYNMKLGPTTPTRRGVVCGVDSVINCERHLIRKDL